LKTDTVMSTAELSM